ncbi:unnamed protein product [Arctogadus glacialis]
MEMKGGTKKSGKSRSATTRQERQTSDPFLKTRLEHRGNQLTSGALEMESGPEDGGGIAFWTIALSWMVLAGRIIHSDVTCPEPLLRQNVFCEHCMNASLQCVISGLRTAEDWCQDNNAKIELILDGLPGYTASQPTPSNATACVCEAGPSAPWDDFLGYLTSLLQKYATMQLTAGDAKG